MLRSLSIRDFVIVDRLDLEFGAGFTALTGETGAGKSILVDALALVLGERSDAGSIREGCARAEISAEFSLEAAPATQRWLADTDLADDTGVCILRRVLESGGRSRAYVNGRPCTLQQIKDLGALLVDIHGQHEHQSLMRPAAQRMLLDGYAGAQQQADEVARAWREWQELRRRREDVERNARALAQEREHLEFQARELERLNFTVDEWDALQADHKRLAHAVSLLEAVDFALEALSEGEGAALASVNAAVSRLGNALEYDSALRETLDVLEPAQIQIQEAVYALRHYRDRIDVDPKRLAEAERRLEAVHSTARRFRVTPERLPELLAQVSGRLAELGASADPAELARREAAAEQSYLDLGRALSRERERAARALSDRVTQAMQTLAMAGGVFQVALAPIEGGSVTGLEQVEFQVAAHPGTTPRGLSKVASGGELSRISLAIQTAATEVTAVPTLIFDEVDAGIGGRVAEIVGRLLKQLGRRHQVMCITHLAQVAAAADHQWQVSKRAVKGAVRSEVRQLEPDARVEEIARMLGGVKITPTTRQHAAELLGMERGTADRGP
jgi:DNA repair protein RecN (Recombination protein N)